MATINKLIQEPVAPVKSAALIENEAMSRNRDASAENLAHTLVQSMTKLWGTPDNLRDPQEALDVLNADYANSVANLTAHAAMIAAAESSGVITFEAWEKETPYVLTPGASSFTIGDTLAQSWVDAAAG